MSSNAITLLNAMPWYAWVAIAGMVCGCITGVIKLKDQHRERMEMIRQGMHPDAPHAVKPTGEREI
jgi:hypothetical protein